MTIVSDSFNRTDDSSGLGVADSGQTWQAVVGVWGISSNQAQWKSGNPAIAVIDSGQSDIQISLDSIVSTSGQPSGAIAFRLSDMNNYWLFRNLSSVNQLYKFANGSATLVASTSYTLNAETNFKVVANGASINCYVDGVDQFGTITDSFNQTKTKHGLRNHVYTTTNFDNFIIDTVGTQSTGTPVTYTYDTKQTIYKNINLNTDTKQSIYANRLTNYDTKQVQYKPIQTSYDSKQVIYKAIQELFDTEQVFAQEYTQVTYNYDVKIEQYKHIQESIDTKQAIYKDISLDLDTKQIVYKQIQNLYDTLIQLRNEHDETIYATLTIQRVIEHHLKINNSHEDTLKIERVLNHILRI